MLAGELQSVVDDAKCLRITGCHDVPPGDVQKKARCTNRVDRAAYEHQALTYTIFEFANHSASKGVVQVCANEPDLRIYALIRKRLRSLHEPSCAFRGALPAGPELAP